MWFSTSSGCIELKMTMKQAESATHPGPCDDDVMALSKQPNLRRQLAKIDEVTLVQELKEYGAWDEVELADHAQNLQRLVWIAAGDIVDRFYCNI